MYLSCTPSTMSPRSCSRTGAPLRYATTIGRYCAALINCPLACNVNARCGPVICPVGKIYIPGLERRFHFIDAHLMRRHRVRVHLHVHRVFLLAEHLHLRDAARHRDALRDARLGVFIQGPQRNQLGRQNQINNGLIGGIHLGERRRRRHALRQQSRRPA